jgi:hypothetical protein
MKRKLVFNLVLACGLVLAVVGCGGASGPTANQGAPTSAPATNSQPTSAPSSNQPLTTAAIPTTIVEATAVPTEAAGATEAPTQETAPTEAATEQPTQATAPTEAPTTGAAPTTAPTANAPTGGSAAADIITDAQRAALSAKSYRSTTVTTTADGKTGTSVAEFVAPDRIHEVINTGGRVVTEIIVIRGQGMWQKQNGKWMKLPAQAGETFFRLFDPKFYEEVRKGINIGTVQLVGADVLNGKPTLVYSYTTELDAGSNTTALKGSYKIWIGALDHRAYKIEGNSESLLVKGGKNHIVSTFEYDIPITIEPPV